MEENCTKLECSGGHSIDELRKQSSMSKAETKPNNAPRKSVRERIEERSSQPCDDFSAYASSHWKQSGAEIKAPSKSHSQKLLASCEKYGA